MQSHPIIFCLLARRTKISCRTLLGGSDSLGSREKCMISEFSICHHIDLWQLTSVKCGRYRDSPNGGPPMCTLLCRALDKEDSPRDRPQSFFKFVSHRRAGLATGVSIHVQNSCFNTSGFLNNHSYHTSPLYFRL